MSRQPARARVICQGITGEAGRFHTQKAVEYGTRMVGGVTPGRAGRAPTASPSSTRSRRRRRRRAPTRA